MVWRRRWMTKRPHPGKAGEARGNPFLPAGAARQLVENDPRLEPAPWTWSSCAGPQDW